MDLVLFLTCPLFAFMGASIFGILLLARVIGGLTASVFVAMFYVANQMGEAVSRARPEPRA